MEEDRSIVVAGTPYLAGSNLDLWRGVRMAVSVGAMTVEEAIDSVSRHPAQLLGRPRPLIAEGQAADLVIYRLGDDDEGFDLAASCVGGEWTIRDEEEG